MFLPVKFMAMILTLSLIKMEKGGFRLGSHMGLSLFTFKRLTSAIQYSKAVGCTKFWLKT
jgi:hypothetical protein